MNQLWHWGLRALPFFLCTVAVLGQYANLFMINGQSLLMTVVYGGIFFAAVFNTRFLSPICVFALGLLADALQSHYFGLNTFSFMTFYFITVLGASVLKDLDFIGLWISFIAINICCCLLTLGLTGILTGKASYLTALEMQLLLNSIFYPVILVLCHKLNQLIGLDDDSVEV